MPRFGDRRDWFFERRFGLFVHWGIYAIPAFHEQVQNVKHVPRGEYEKLAGQFNPVRFDPDAWLDLAEAAGMGYVCFTTKHADGFCMWDTKQTDYNTMNTPYGRDVLAMLADACRRRGLPLCLYHSVLDWHHPNYPNEGRHHELPGPEPGDEPDFDRYLEFMKAQVRELCTEYGELGGFWWDTNVPELHDPSINAMIRELQPAAVINNRGFDEGDFGTPEREYDPSVAEQLTYDRPTEACQSVGRWSWGYKSDEDYYSDAHLIRSIGGFLAKGANYLLNVGPMADGTIPDEAAAILRRIGVWFHAVRESFEGAEPASHLIENRDVLLTRKGNDLYVHLVREPASGAVSLAPIDALPREAVLLNDGRPVEAYVGAPGHMRPGVANCLRLRELPANEFEGTVMVVKLTFDEFPKVKES